MAFSNHHYFPSSSDRSLDIQHQHSKLHGTAPLQLCGPIEDFFQSGPMGPTMEFGSTIRTQRPSYFDPVALEEYPPIQMSGQWPPYYDQPSHSFQASEIGDYPDTKKPCHTTKLDSKALGSLQSQPRASPTGHYKQPQEERDTSELLRCEWKDCDYLGTFTNEGTLVRHVRTVHVSPSRFNCTICGKRFGRKDRYRTHRQMAHSQASVRK